jgi:hypothetical protein
MMDAQIRKIVIFSEEVMIEGGKAVPKPYRIAAAAAVLTSPWAGRGFVEDLRPEINRVAPLLGDLLVPRLLATIGELEAEAYGKAAIVGTAGEVEHASALIHTLRFGNQLRQAVSGTSYLSFTNKRAGPGCSIDIPLKHKTAEGTRSHFMTASFSIPDAPAPDEIIVALGIATGGRPHHRIGDRYEDMKEMGVDQTGRETARLV